MALKIKKSEQVELARLTEAVRDKAQEFAEVKEKWLKAVEELSIDVRRVEEELQNHVNDLSTYIDEKAGELRDEFEEKSDDWKESVRGQSVEEFICAWENNPCEEVTPCDLSIELDEYDDGWTEAVDSLPMEPE